MPTPTTTVLSWNIGRRGLPALEPLTSLPIRPDVLALQEVGLPQASEICGHLGDIGYASVYSCEPNAVEKRYGNVLAALAPLQSSPVSSFDFPWPQLVAHAKVESWAGPIDVVTVHVPNGSRNGWQKIRTLEALKRLVLSLKDRPVILSGDFNEPRWTPLQDGHIVTWGQERSAGRWVPWNTWTFHNVSGSGESWDAAVRWYFEHTDQSGLRNAYWDVAGRGAMQPTHLSHGAKRWFDHVFVSDHFAVNACEYQHAFRERGFSDHSALFATLGLRTV
jgi:endonuclease/exonuclease/phosphatase family metal-dependent hydrolase